MSEIKRHLNLLKLLDKKSFFLMGPRSTGKSTLIQQQLADQAVMIDLLASDYLERLLARPQALADIIASSPDRKIVVIDEIQKLPVLLDEVHRLIEQKKEFRFLLTGSSARKLKHGQADLLAGRAWMAELFPLTWNEIPKFDLERYLRFGGLPIVYLSEIPVEELHAYVRTYLYEEIKAEALVRKLAPFSRFLEVAALANTEMLQWNHVASDSGVPASTVREYYSVLEDTLMGYLLLPWTKSKRRKAIQTAKFYFFDIGVAHSLAKVRALDRHSDLYGKAFEHFIGMELRAYTSYARTLEDICYWRSVNDQEVDYLLGDHTAIEVKATQKATPRHLRGLKALREEGVFKSFYLVSQDPIAMVHDGIFCLPWQEFLKRLWAGEVGE